MSYYFADGSVPTLAMIKWMVLGDEDVLKQGEEVGEEEEAPPEGGLDAVDGTEPGNLFLIQF